MKNNSQKGIALFIAVVAVSAMILIALAISDISYSEQIITSTGRDSKIAFYAADTGIECALFHDWARGMDGNFEFATSTNGQSSVPGIHCANYPSEIVGYVDGNGSSATTTFYFNVSSTPKACAIVQMAKWSPDGLIINTRIESRGYNDTCKDDGPTDSPRLTDTSNPRNLERSFRMTY